MELKQIKRVLFTVIGLIVGAILLMPVSFFLAILLFPLWRWIEASYGIEAIGHSGPAEWCFFVVYVVLSAGGLILFVWARRQMEVRA